MARTDRWQRLDGWFSLTTRVGGAILRTSHRCRSHTASPLDVALGARRARFRSSPAGHDPTKIGSPTRWNKGPAAVRATRRKPHEAPLECSRSIDRDTAVRGKTPHALTRIDVGVTPPSAPTESARPPQVGALRAHLPEPATPVLHAGPRHGTCGRRRRWIGRALNRALAGVAR